MPRMTLEDPSFKPAEKPVFLVKSFQDFKVFST